MTLHLHPRPPFLYTQQIENHEYIKAQLMPHILSFYQEHKDDEDYHWGNINVVNNHRHQSVELFTNQILNDLIWNPTDNMIEEMNGHYPIPARSHLAGIWWNIYPAGSYAQVHDHRGYDLSGVYFMHMNEPNTLVFQPDSNDSFFPWTADTLYTDKMTQEGSLVLFPSGLKHYVTPVSEMRISISFNLICDITDRKTNPMKMLIS